MPSLSVKLPLTKDPRFGFSGNTRAEGVAKQNLKMLILTSPGERMMIPDFGVGIRRYFFENLVPETFAAIESRIMTQVAKYLPYITIKNISFREGNDPTQVSFNQQFDTNLVAIQIHYTLNVMGTSPSLRALEIYL